MTTYVLVHGAWHAAQVWDRVAPLLTAAGHRVVAPDLTGHGAKAHLLTPEVGLETHASDVVEAIRGQDEEVVLVGHSYAGLVISSAANQVPDRVAELVYLDAMVPEDGETAVDVMPVTAVLIEQAAVTAAPWRIPPMPEHPAPYGLFGVTDPDDVAWVRSMLGDESLRCYQQPVRMDDPALAAVPRTHIHCVGHAPAGVERRPVTGGRVWELDSGHDCMVTVPDALAELLLRL